MAVKISGMMGTGSLGHNNRKFHTENVDPTRSELNITLCRENLRQVYEDTFGEALAAYNAGKKKTRDKYGIDECGRTLAGQSAPSAV